MEVRKCTYCGDTKDLRRYEGKLYCNKHAWQLRRHGKILERTKYDKNEIICHDDYAEIVIYDQYGSAIAKTRISLDKVEKVKGIKWCLAAGSYVKGKVNKKLMFLHRFLLDLPEDTDLVVDHISHDTLDNRNENLRVCSVAQNAYNRDKSPRNTSGFRGVSWCKERNKWIAWIVKDGKTINLGGFDKISEAKEARLNAEVEQFGEYRFKEGA